MTTTNGGPGQTAAQDTQPQLTVVSQYIKDFSFENPNAPQSLAPRQEQPQIGIQINVGAKPLSDTDVEVGIKLEGKAEAAGHAFSLRIGVRWCIPPPQRPAGEPEPGRTHRVPAAAVPVRARNHRDRRPQWRLSTTPA